MKQRTLFLTLLLGALALTSFTTRASTEADETPLAEHMESIEDAVKRLRRSLRDPEQLTESLALVQTLQTEALTAKGFVPAMAADVPEAERAAFVTGYRRMMVDFLAAQLELEAALLDGDAETAKAAFSKVRDMEDTGHERFTAGEDEDH